MRTLNEKRLIKAVAELHTYTVGEGYYEKAFTQGWHQALNQVELLMERHLGARRPNHADTSLQKASTVQRQRITQG